MFFLKALSQSKYLLSALTGVLLTGSAFAGTAGRVNFIVGEATATAPDNTTRILYKGDLINSGEKLETTTNGRVQIRFTDGSFLSLKPNSVFNIEKYSFSRDTPDQGSAVFNFIRGGMRTISGAIGKVNRTNYKMNTPFATIGIRGTDYSLTSQNDKVIAFVTHGKIAIDNNAGSAEVNEGETFEVAADSSPKPSKEKITPDTIESEEEALQDCYKKSIEITENKDSGLCKSLQRQTIATTASSIIPDAIPAGEAEQAIQRPRLDNFANYNEFIQAMYIYKKAEADRLLTAELVKQLQAKSNLPEMNMDELTELETGPSLVVTGPEDLETAIDQAKFFTSLSQIERFGLDRTNFKNFPLQAEDSQALENFAISDTLQFLLMNNGVTSNDDDSVRITDEIRRLSGNGVKLSIVKEDDALSRLFITLTENLFGKNSQALGINFRDTFVEATSKNIFSGLDLQLFFGARSKDELSKLGVTNSLLTSFDENKNGVLGGGSIRKGLTHDGDGVKTQRNSGSIQIGDGSVQDSTVILTEDSTPISLHLDLGNLSNAGINTTSNKSIISINVSTPKLAIKLGGVYVANSDSAVPGINKDGESTPGSSRVFGTNIDDSTPIQIMDASEIVLGAAKINAKIEHDSSEKLQTNRDGAIKSFKILADAYIKDGVVINNFNLIDAGGSIRGGSIRAKSLKISDYSSHNLTANLAVNFERKNNELGAVITLKQLGDIVNGIDLAISGLQVGGESAQEIGDVEVIGLNINGMQLGIYGH